MIVGTDHGVDKNIELTVVNGGMNLLLLVDYERSIRLVFWQ